MTSYARKLAGGLAQYALALLVAGGDLAPAHAASDPDCSLPPAGAWPTTATDGGTFDSNYVKKWSGDQNLLNVLWNGVRAEKDDWDEGWGFDDPGDLDRMLSRLLNAAYIVREVERHAKHYGIRVPVILIPDAKYTEGMWWDFVSNYGEDEWEPGCETVHNASYGYVPFDWFYTLRLPGAYQYGASSRSAVLVHETVHEDVDHVDEDECTPPSQSCDFAYGYYNANTLQINYLMDAYTTYRTEPGTDGVVHQMAMAGDECGYVNYFSPIERAVMKANIASVSARFALSLFIPTWEMTAKTDAATWDCTKCDVDGWVFDANKCSQPACNEVLNPDNHGINLVNKVACAVYNGAVVQSTDPSDVLDAKEELTADSKKCLSPKAEAATEYCWSQIETASEVSDIDKCGWLEGVHDPMANKLSCVELFCQGKFEETGGVGWDTGDPFGCMDYLCQGGGCGDAGSKDICIFSYRLTEGNPTKFVPNCQLGGCHAGFMYCVHALYEAGEWSFGQPMPSECITQELSCGLAAKLAAIVASSIIPQVDPGPMKELLAAQQITSPAKSTFTYTEAIASAAATGANNLQQLAVGLTAAPERAAMLYQLAPAKLSYLYGAEAFAPVVGPSGAFVKPEAITDADLTPVGQEAYSQLKSLLATVPEGTMKGAFGTLSIK